MSISFRIKGIPFRYKGAINVEDCETAEDVIVKDYKYLENITKIPVAI